MRSRRRGITWESVYREYHDKIEGYLRYRLNDSADAEDLATEVFMKVQANLDRYDPSKASLSTWVYTIARNTLYDFYRANHIESDVPETLASDDEDVDEGLIAEESLQELAMALAQMPEDERDLIILRFYDGLTIRDAADKLGLSRSTCQRLQDRAIDRLRGLMGNPGGLRLA